MSTVVRGAKELEAKLKALPAKVSGKIGRQALRAGAKVIAAAEKSEAPVKSGRLKKGVKVRATKRKRGRGPGVLAMLPAGTSPTFYGPFVELGHKLGRRKRNADGKKQKAAADTRQSTTPDPFIQRAYERTKQQALDLVEQKLREGIERV